MADLPHLFSPPVNAPEGVRGNMLLVIPVPFRRSKGALMIEAQATNGIDRWADNFEQVTVAAPVMPEELARTSNGIVWKDESALMARERVKLVRLPWAYELTDFLRHYGAVKLLLRRHIRECSHLQFAIGALVGDWAAVAALEAAAQNRKFAIHADRVEHELLLRVTRGASWPRRLKADVFAALMRRYHRRVIRKCSVGLWHGSDCFHAYSSWCPENFTIHDIHTKRSDYISEPALLKKVTGLETSSVVDICYAGRLDPMKAPLDWLQAIAVSRDLGAPIRAVWYGDGPLRNEAEAEISRLKLSEIVRMPGFVSDRGDLLAAIRNAHMMLFTHITPESPRCLIEALLSGTPIVGYESRFTGDLTDGFGGGSFVPTNDWENLGRRIAFLATNRPALIQLIRNAARSGERFNDAAVFEERSRLVKQFA